MVIQEVQLVQQAKQTLEWFVRCVELFAAKASSLSIFALQCCSKYSIRNNVSLDRPGQLYVTCCCDVCVCVPAHRFAHVTAKM